MSKKEKKIIIVDDSDFTRSVLRGILEDNDFKNIIEMKDGEQLLSSVDEANPDLILLDMIMPKVSGFEVLKRIDSKWKIIVVSAVESSEIVDEVKEFGVTDYITKPFNEKIIIEKIKLALKR